MAIPCGYEQLCDPCEKLNAKIQWLEELLKERDDFLVSHDKWIEFTQWLNGRDHSTIAALYDKTTMSST